MPSSNAFLKQAKQRIESTLKRFFDSEMHKARHPLSLSLMRSVGEFTMRKGGKRARGILVLLGYLTNTKNRITGDILKVAAAYELLHSYLLIHDDIIDRDFERRGGPTLHKIFERTAPSVLSRNKKEKIGLDSAIIAGDVAADLVQRIVLRTKFTYHQKIETLELLERILHTTYVGQVLDILALPEKLPSMQDQLTRYFLKTSTYTIEGPFLTGVQLGKARIDKKAFHAFALDAGLAFQLANDLQNVYSTGYAGTSSDIREGKITLLVSYALASRKYRLQILRLLQQQDKTPGDVATLRSLITMSGGYAKARSVVMRYHARAARRVEKLKLPPIVSGQFRALLDMIINLMNT
ncbi:MAG: hypothetical protein A2898_02310 [Candidatus Kerfeldbacteria bacterium RIFCSPLOWO2_01_FULL_48_11]|uniref:Geranylgeranyl pyrophosphate synthase n=1 Tax=Candidatus Kerfeldbacteria bacterium RIFCSPLOWO2_01_FULL_48_11 TaxID=1798543 RepID=A0A1G2B1N3_9BACT|nr:MAG: Geranylgeranyl pyrophosphate synthase [Parcubacteria group bacterium GW2011_GWA2_48_9]KKW16393.1 MAG: Geranylgeranyl pyrophosphate synthase [Parcubacteria group bacterium GW2011_GWC2_49_9]OGY83092.1 MAG: hypothetical protein A2898_02310 [Candidatus Kerfeldbacteria bacterium RIFCSPLOWO2_01_FULL_48_11]HCM68114.1 hypothetical protein [Candidatus Kerfeldbacteria bacterium]